MRPLLFASLALLIALASGCATTPLTDSDGGLAPTDAPTDARGIDAPPTDAHVEPAADASAPPGCVAGWHTVASVPLVGGVRPDLTVTSIAARDDGSAALTYELTPLDGSERTTTLVWLDATGAVAHTESVARGAQVLRHGADLAAILGDTLVTLTPSGRGTTVTVPLLAYDTEFVGDALCGLHAPAGSTGTSVEAACAVPDASGWTVVPMGRTFSIYDAPRVAFGQSASASRPDRALVMFDGSYHSGSTAGVDLLTLDAAGNSAEMVMTFGEEVIADAQYDALADGFDVLLGGDTDPAPDGFAFQPVVRHVDTTGMAGSGLVLGPSVEIVFGWGLAGSLVHGPASLAAAYASASTNQNLQLDVFGRGGARHERDPEVVGNGDRPLLAADDHGYVLASVARASVSADPDRVVFRCDVAE